MYDIDLYIYTCVWYRFIYIYTCVWYRFIYICISTISGWSQWLDHVQPHFWWWTTGIFDGAETGYLSKVQSSSSLEWTCLWQYLLQDMYIYIQLCICILYALNIYILYNIHIIYIYIFDVMTIVYYNINIWYMYIYVCVLCIMYVYYMYFYLHEGVVFDLAPFLLINVVNV